MMILLLLMISGTYKIAIRATSASLAGLYMRVAEYFTVEHILHDIMSVGKVHLVGR